jgi:hypothetical protein
MNDPFQKIEKVIAAVAIRLHEPLKITQKLPGDIAASAGAIMMFFPVLKMPLSIHFKRLMKNLSIEMNFKHY